MWYMTWGNKVTGARNQQRATGSSGSQANCNHTHIYIYTCSKQADCIHKPAASKRIAIKMCAGSKRIDFIYTCCEQAYCTISKGRHRIRTSRQQHARTDIQRTSDTPDIHRSTRGEAAGFPNACLYESVEFARFVSEWLCGAHMGE